MGLLCLYISLLAIWNYLYKNIDELGYIVRISYH